MAADGQIPRLGQRRVRGRTGVKLVGLPSAKVGLEPGGATAYGEPCLSGTSHEALNPSTGGWGSLGHGPFTSYDGPRTCGTGGNPWHDSQLA